MTLHRFGFSNTPGVDRCRCGVERELKQLVNAPFSHYWWYRTTDPETLRKLNPYQLITRSEGRAEMECTA